MIALPGHMMVNKCDLFFGFCFHFIVCFFFVISDYTHISARDIEYDYSNEEEETTLQVEKYQIQAPDTFSELVVSQIYMMIVNSLNFQFIYQFGG